jgi:hypothetical protein
MVYDRHYDIISNSPDSERKTAGKLGCRAKYPKRE